MSYFIVPAYTFNMPVKKEEKPTNPNQPKGLFYLANLFNERQLAKIDTFNKSDRLQTELKAVPNVMTGRVSEHARRAVSFGYFYDYHSHQITEKAEPIPRFIRQVLDFVLNEVSAQLDPTVDIDYFNQLIINEYVPGQGIGAHIDDVKYGDTILVLSFGSAVEIQFTRPDHPNYTQWVDANSVYIMSDEARYKWKHQIVSRKTDRSAGSRVARSTRYSWTFRHVPNELLRQ